MILCDIAGGDEAFRAVEDISVPVLARSGMDPGGVRTCIRFSQAEGADDAVVDDLGNEFILLILGAELFDECGKAVAEQRIGRAMSQARAGQLLDHDHLRNGVMAYAAVFLSVIDTQEPEPHHLLPRFHGETMLLIQRRRFRLAALRRELPHHLSQHFLLFRQLKIHIALLFIRGQKRLSFPADPECPLRRIRILSALPRCFHREAARFGAAEHRWTRI